MSRAASRLDLERGNGSGTLPTTRPGPSSLTFKACIAIANGHFFNRRRSVSFQAPAPRGGLYYRDSSGLLFSMYSKLAEEEDNKMVDRWQKEAEGILIFVSPTVYCIL